MAKAYELIDKPEKHCTTWYAKDKEGDGIAFTNPAAVAFCVLGAIYKTYGKDTPETTEQVQKLLKKVKPRFRRDPEIRVAMWSDSTPWGTIFTTMKTLDI